MISNKNHNCTIDRIVINNNMITNKNDIANHFGTFFASHVSGASSDDIDLNCLNDLRPPDHKISNFSFIEITPETVLNNYKSMKKRSEGPSSVPFKVLQFIDPIFWVHLSILFNLSCISGIFPNHWKPTIINPTHKNGSKDIINNFRPISLLSFLSKLFEKCIASQLKAHLLKNNFLNSYQSGFRPNHSCTTALANSLH